MDIIETIVLMFEDPSITYAFGLILGLVLGFAMGLCISLLLNTRKSLQLLAEASDLVTMAEERWNAGTRLLNEAKALLQQAKEKTG